MNDKQRRLYDLRLAVAEADPERFYMGSWKCGTTCCAAGHYVERFPDRGLSLVPKESEFYGEEEYHIHGEESEDFRALSNHFDLYNYQTLNLFYQGMYETHSSYITKEHVLARIDELIKKLEQQ